jgi:hypothetical protein
MGLAAPYGTRSRNRTGISRPNYAEDKELDAEFEVAASSKDGRKATRGIDPASATATDAGRSAINARKTQASEYDQISSVQNSLKEAIPGTSNFSASPTTNALAGQSSKKRKANGTSTTNNVQQQSQLSSQVSAPAVSRRASLALPGLIGSRETNMLSFETCGNRLKDNKLIADDGTVLEVNGE